jgi:pyruvate dehydrogenase E1 component beta subunit
MQALSARGRFTAVHQRAHRQHAGRATVRVAAQKKQLMMWEALREAVDEEMERDPHVCVMGKHSVAVVHTKCYQLTCKC